MGGTPFAGRLFRLTILGDVTLEWAFGGPTLFQFGEGWAGVTLVFFAGAVGGGGINKTDSNSKNSGEESAPNRELIPHSIREHGRVLVLKSSF